MTRELRYAGDGTGPRHIDHGHWPRKATWLAALVLVAPLALVQLATGLTAAALEHVAGWMDRLAAWSHPCLYARPGESAEAYLKRVRTTTTGQPPVAKQIKLNPEWEPAERKPDA